MPYFFHSMANSEDNIQFRGYAGKKNYAVFKARPLLCETRLSPDQFYITNHFLHVLQVYTAAGIVGVGQGS